jgi:hypothetical protein
MTVLGLRCGSKEFSYSIVRGTMTTPELVESQTIKYPTGFNDSQRVKWFYQEIDGLMKRHSAESLGIKGTEPMAMKGSVFGCRIEMEAMALLAVANNGIKYVKRKVNGTIAKDFGLKGKKKYLETGIDYSKIPDYDSKSANIKESILIAWSMLN